MKLDILCMCKSYAVKSLTSVGASALASIKIKKASSDDETFVVICCYK